MKKVVDNPRLIYKCCKLYYENNYSQNEIADIIGISRVSVSRLLKAGREEGIVQIRVISPNQLGYSELENDLEHLYHLKEAVVIEHDPLATSYDEQAEIRSAAINLLETYLEPGDVVGVSMGRTLYNICGAGASVTNRTDCTFVPVVGGISISGNSVNTVHSNQIARGFADLFGGEFIEFFAPAMFSDKAILHGFMKEKMAHRVLEYYRRMRTVIMGIGTPNHAMSTMIKGGYIRQAEIDKMVEAGMVGDISLQYFDRAGRTEVFRSFNDRVAGLSLEEMRKVENRICIGTGARKAEALLGAIQGGFVNILITDSECAQKLIEFQKG